MRLFFPIQEVIAAVTLASQPFRDLTGHSLRQIGVKSLLFADYLKSGFVGKCRPPSNTLEAPSVPRSDSLDRRGDHSHLPVPGPKFLHVALVPPNERDPETQVLKTVTDFPLVAARTNSLLAPELEQISHLLFGPGKTDMMKHVQLWYAVGRSSDHVLGLQCAYKGQDSKWSKWMPETRAVELGRYSTLASALRDPSFRPMVPPEMQDSMDKYVEASASSIKELESWTWSPNPGYM
ncbi:hypothetical protein F5878DRAFT_729670 [Lentinula raphanica]|uniref:Uncharacterized protein n=1 Tax=Lentinula raphanica TaxID=153919 RepID=A0AA38NVI1_9AGAR|nr:hypothetical protein F5878DRAFT_729670 [Lentinula raphanica]